MTDEPEDEILELTEEVEAEEPEAAEVGEDEFSIELEGEEAEAEETPLMRELRLKLRDRDRELASYRKVATPKIEVGDKPTLESCDYDADAFEAKLDEWKDRKRQADNQEADIAKQAEVRNQEFERKAASYRAKLAALPIPAAEKVAAEQAVIAALPELYQSTIVQYADDPAKVAVALARHPKKLEHLAQITDPGQFLKEIILLERNLKVVTRKKPPAPDAENVLQGSASVGAADSDKEEARLWKAYEKSGSNADLDAYRSHQREKRKAA
jgi:hypothetical protein